jgi:hypothetical protein
MINNIMYNKSLALIHRGEVDENDLAGYRK